MLRRSTDHVRQGGGGCRFDVRVTLGVWGGHFIPNPNLWTHPQGGVGKYRICYSTILVSVREGTMKIFKGLLLLTAMLSFTVYMTMTIFCYVEARNDFKESLDKFDTDSQQLRDALDRRYGK